MKSKPCSFDIAVSLLIKSLKTLEKFLFILILDTHAGIGNFYNKIYVTAQDADLEACQRIVEGTQLVTVYKPVEALAKLAAEYAVQLACGNKIEANGTFYDGTYNVPYVAIEPSGVTSENLDKVIIDGGFHLREEIYKR